MPQRKREKSGGRVLLAYAVAILVILALLYGLDRGNGSWHSHGEGELLQQEEAVEILVQEAGVHLDDQPIGEDELVEILTNLPPEIPVIVINDLSQADDSFKQVIETLDQLDIPYQEAQK